MRNVLTLGFVLLLGCSAVAGCSGAGMQDAENQSRAAQVKAMEGRMPGLSIWSMFGGNVEGVRKRLDAGLGKTKSEETVTFGEPFKCGALQAGGEVCGWFDDGMSNGGTTEASQHVVYFTFDLNGKASAWDYQGAYGKHSSRDTSLPSP